MKTLAFLIALTISQTILGIQYETKSDSLSKNIVQKCQQICCKSNTIDILNKQSIDNKIKDYLPWITALLIAFLSSYITWQVSKNQIKSNKENIILQVNSANISNKRQEWIDNLRKNIAEIIKNHMILVLKIRTETGSTYIYEFEEFREILELVILVDLSLNPNEEESKNLMTLLKEYTNDYDFSKADSFTRIDNIVRTTQKILKNEWNRVKKSE